MQNVRYHKMVNKKKMMNNKITNNNLLLEVKKIHNLMNITHNGLILETATIANFVKILVSKFGDDFTKLTTTIAKKDKTTFNSIINKLKSNTQLLDNEIEFLGRYISWDKIATKAITDNTLFGSAFIQGLKKSISGVKTNPSKYKGELRLWENMLDNPEYNYIPKTIKDNIKAIIKNKFDIAAGKIDDVTPGRIVDRIVDNNLTRVLPIKFTKFVDNVVSNMVDSAKKVNDNINKINQGGLNGEEIKNLEKEILKDMQTIYLNDRKLIDYMTEEINSGAANSTGDVRKAFNKAKDLMGKLKSETTKDGGIPWKSGPLVSKITNKWSIFIKETLRESFGEWYSLFRMINKSKPVKSAKQVIDNINGIQDNLVDNVAKKNVGSSVIPFWKRQIFLTTIGSGRGIPFKGASPDAYEEIIKAFPKNSLNYARASLLLEKVIKVIKMSIYIQIFSVIAQFLGFGSADKKLQKKYGPCINELTKILKTKKITADQLTANDLPQCLITLINDKTITEKELSGIMIRANYFANEETVLEGIINKLDLDNTLINFVFGSRVRLLNEIRTISSDWYSSLITGEDSIIDKFVLDLTEKVQKLKSEIKPFKITDNKPTEIPNTNDTTSEIDIKKDIKPVVPCLFEGGWDVSLEKVDGKETYVTHNSDWSKKYYLDVVKNNNITTVYYQNTNQNPCK